MKEQGVYQKEEKEKQGFFRKLITINKEMK